MSLNSLSYEQTDVITEVRDLDSLGSKAIFDQVNVKDYGAVGDGVTDDTSAINLALTEAASIGGSLVGGEGDTYLVSVVAIPNGVKEFNFSKSTIKGTSPVDNSVVVTLDASVEKCTVKANIDMSGGDYIGIESYGSDNVFEDCRIYGFTNHATENRYGILLRAGADNNIIRNNTIECYTSPTTTHIGIDLVGTDGDEDGWGGFYTGAAIEPTLACKYNRIIDNTITNGTHAIVCLSSIANQINSNMIIDASHRGIYVSSASSKNIISGNTIENSGSSGILLGYCSYRNEVSGNMIFNDNDAHGEAAINITTGASYNSIAKNIINSSHNYGVYLGVNMVGNVVDGNIIKDYYQCGIALENEWQDTPNGLAVYSRSNYTAPAIGSTWATIDSELNVIQNNIIDDEYTGRTMGGIYVAQLGSDYKMQDNIIRNNSIIRPYATSYPICFYEDTTGYLIDNVLENNYIKDANITYMYFSRGRSHFKKMSGNSGLDTDVWTFADGDTTPSVGKGGFFKCANTSATSITDFDEGFDSQEIKVKLDQNTQINYGGGYIHTKASGNISGSTALSEWVTFKNYLGVWYEIGRSF